MGIDSFIALVQDGKTAHTTEEVAEVIGAVNDLVLTLDRKFDPTAMNAVFSLADPELIAPTIQVAMLRGSFPFRERLEAWLPFRDKVRTVLIARSLDADRILRGL
jgi:hypothetical protein